MGMEKPKTLEESIIMAMDGSDPGLIPFLAYILQDCWEIGTDPNAMIDLIRKHAQNHSNLRVLDLGCGKGAVSIKIAQEFKCDCLGIDAIKEFIDEANRKVKEHGVDLLCHFEVGDIRERVKSLRGFDIVILGSIGPVFGNYFQTLESLKECVTDDGIIIIDDGYIANDSEYTHPLILKRDVVLKQIIESGFRFIDEVIIDRNRIKKSNAFIYGHLKKRCSELIEKYPDKKGLFKNYIASQEEENKVLEQKVICAVMVIARI